MEPSKCEVQGLKAGLGGKDVIKPGLELHFLPGTRCTLVGLEVLIQLPDLASHYLHGGALFHTERQEGVDRACGMNPTQRVAQDIKLPCIITENDQVGRNLMTEHAPQ